MSQLLSAKKGRYFRFDVDLGARGPALDNLTEMDRIGKMARETIWNSSALEKLVYRLRAELFIFELDDARPFQRVNGTYECVGHIQCRLRAKTPEFEALMSQLDQGSAVFRFRRWVLQGSFQDRSSVRHDGNFFKRVRFQIRSREEPFSIALEEGPGTTCQISGSPFTLQRLLSQQSLEAWFGTPDHQPRKRKNTETYEPERQKRPRRR